MIQQTVARLLPLARPKNFWVITNSDLRPAIVSQLHRLFAPQILAEPAGRNTAPAIGLAAFLLLRQNPDAVLGLFPSDHTIADEKTYRKTLQQGIRIAAAGDNIVVLGVRPIHPETGYGYIETGDATASAAFRVRRFTEKPDAARAAEFVQAGNYLWNSGMFLWSARTLTRALEEHLPLTAKLLAQIAATFGTQKFPSTFKRLYPKCENISVDYAILERRSAQGEAASNIFCVPADFGWNDLGSWSAHYEHETAKERATNGNLVFADATFALNSTGNYIRAKNKFVALVGVTGLVVVETDDALLITTREHAQDVGKVVKYLDDRKLHKLT